MPIGKKPLYTGVRIGCRYIFCLSVCVSVSVCNIRRFRCLRELHEADFYKPGIYGSGRVWANAWDVFPRMPSRVGRGRQGAVDFVVCFGLGVFFCVFFSIFFSLERTRPAASMRPPCLIYSLLVMRNQTSSRSYGGRFLPLGQKSLFIPGCVQSAII